MKAHMLGIVALTTACAAGDTAKAEFASVDSAGVALVTNGGADRPLRWQATTRELATPPDLGMVGPHMIAGTEAGRLYVLDADAHRVVVLDMEAGVVGEHGRRGRGPGELSRPIGLSMTPAGELRIHDYGRGAILRWDTAGIELGTLPLPSDFWGPAMGWAGATTYNAAVPRTEGSPGADELVWLGHDGRRVLATVPRTGWQKIPLTECGGYPLELAPAFAPDIVWSADGRRVAAASRVAYEVDVFEAGTLVRRIRRAAPAPVADAEAARVETEQWARRVFPPNMPCTPNLADLARRRGVAPDPARVVALALDPAGQLWVQRRTSQPGVTATDVFDAEGRYLGTAPADWSWPAAFSGSGFVGLRELPTGEQRLVLYELR